MSEQINGKRKKRRHHRGMEYEDEAEKRGNNHMTLKERKSCINTINLLRRLAFNVHGVIDVIDNENCDKLIALLYGGIDEIYMKHYKQGLADAKNPPEAVFNP